jgi:hypothetical protein
MKRKPKVRIIHHLGRAGGTIITRCIASMKGVVVLSEIHPDNLKIVPSGLTALPMKQAHQWYGLVSAKEAKQRINFADAIMLISKRAHEKGLTLVLRNLAHVDFIPHYSRPSFSLRILEELSDQFDIIQCATVRHPIDQWLSYSRQTHFKENSVSLREFLFGYRRFTELASEMGFFRYEDFTARPDKEVSRKLKLHFDSSYQKKWNKNFKITGDWLGIAVEDTIRQNPFWEIDDRIMAPFLKNSDYKKALRILGYTSQRNV